jgi:hypothetical protein
MTTTTLDKPQVGDLVMDYGGDVGVISLIETDKEGTLYFVLWTSGGLTGYSTAHKPKEIRAWTKNVRFRLDKL